LIGVLFSSNLFPIAPSQKGTVTDGKMGLVILDAKPSLGSRIASLNARYQAIVLKKSDVGRVQAAEGLC
jgi:hypothetical protein